MGTRGVVGFFVDEAEKVTYNHFDSYPECLGVAVIEFLRDTDLDALPETVRSIQLVDSQSTPTDEQIEACREFTNLGVGEQSEKDWYCLLRDAQGDLTAYTEHGLPFMIDSKGFLADSLFCEWAYIINLDEGTLEVYKGFNKEEGGDGRYASQKDGDYFGVVLILTIPLAEAKEMDPQEFVKQVNTAAGYEDDEEEDE